MRSGRSRGLSGESRRRSSRIASFGSCVSARLSNRSPFQRRGRGPVASPCELLPSLHRSLHTLTSDIPLSTDEHRRRHSLGPIRCSRAVPKNRLEIDSPIRALVFARPVKERERRAGMPSVVPYGEPKPTAECLPRRTSIAGVHPPIHPLSAAPRVRRWEQLPSG